VVSVLTVGGLAQRMVELFWPLAAEAAGFAHPDEPPAFLTLETPNITWRAWFVATRPALFRIRHHHRNRLYSQIVDNLNKAAVVAFHTLRSGAPESCLGG